MNHADGKTGILIVDDREDKLLALEAVLGDMDLNLVRANSGREALRWLLQQEFAAILLDVNMPGMDGLETAALIRQRKSSQDTPILFITAYGDEQGVARGYALGAVDFILTPLIPQVLRAKVSVFVELHRKTQEIRRQAEKLRQRGDQLAALAAELTQAEQRERRRLAHAIHDNLQQVLIAAQMRLNILGRQIDGKGADLLAQVDELLRKSTEISRSLTMQLSPPILYDLGLVAAIEWLIPQMLDQHGLVVEFQAQDGVELRDESLRALAFQALRELLFNIVKHAGVDRALVTVARGPENLVRLSIEDDGAGFDPAALETARSRGEHFGLFSISERVRHLNGRFEISSSPGAGTRITLELPDHSSRPMESPAEALISEIQSSIAST